MEKEAGSSGGERLGVVTGRKKGRRMGELSFYWLISRLILQYNFCDTC
jgi:hypothetical protein